MEFFFRNPAPGGNETDIENGGHSERWLKNGPAGRKKLRLPRFCPRRLLAVVALCVLLAETLETLIHRYMPPSTPGTGFLLDSIDILVILSPTYFLLYRPFKASWDRRQALEKSLVMSEERLGLAMQGISDVVWDWDIATGELFFTPRGETLLGFRKGEVERHFSSWEHLVHPEDKAPVMRILKEHLEGRSPYYESEHRLRAKSGEWVWVHARGKVVDRTPEGKALRMIGIISDITPRKRVEEEIRHLTRRLINASEEERKRFSRDLHDEFGQVLTGLQLGLEVLKESLREDQEEEKKRCERLVGLIAQLGDHVRDISATLMPAVFDEMGLVATLHWDIETWRRQSPGLDIDLQADELPPLEPEVEIALYRVCQESLNNVIRHAKAHQARVQLVRRAGRVILTVTDDGIGFDEKAARPPVNGRWRIGIAGMRERIAALGGQLHIDSEKGKGTTVRVEVPVAPEEPG